MDDDDWCDDEATVGLVQRAVSRERGCMSARTFVILASTPPAQTFVSPRLREAATTLSASGGQRVRTPKRKKYRQKAVPIENKLYLCKRNYFRENLE